MDIFKRVFFAAMLAGIVAGIFQSAIMQWRVVPLIFEAELYEISESHAVEHAADAQPVAPHKHEISSQPWEPQDGFERGFYTILATILVSLGFALIMGAISTLFSVPITPSNGLIWGMAGFLSFYLMPAIGLPPNLPGMITAELGARQIWWWGTVITTGVAMLLVVKYPKPIILVLAIILFLSPHIIGAPKPPDVSADVPAQLSTLYAANTIFTSFSFWLFLGWFYGFVEQQIFKKKAG